MKFGKFGGQYVPQNLKERLYETRKQISMRLNHDISYNIPGDE